MSPRPGQDPNSPQFQDSLNRWKQENNLSAAPDGNSYGAFMNLPSGSRVDRRFVDKDGDGTDDRYQSGPGKPRGGGTGGVKPMPVKPSPVRPAPISPISPRPTMPRPFDGKMELKRLQRQQAMEFNKHGGAFGDNYQRQKDIDRLVVGLDGPKTGFYGTQADPLTGGRTSVLTNEGDRRGNYIFKNGSWQQTQPTPLKPSPMQVTPTPETGGTSSQPNYPGTRPDYQRGRRKPGLGSLRAM